MLSFATISQFLKEVQLELKKVSWPTREETIRLTTIVIVVSAILGVYIGGLDAILAKMVQKLIVK